MSKIGLFFGSDTGNTEDVASRIQSEIGEDLVDVHNIADSSVDEILEYDKIIIGTPTWYDGEHQGDWEEVIEDLEEADFSGKTVALFGLGDQYGYADYFLDAMGMIADILRENGANLVGDWSADGYDFSESKAFQDGKFVGLALDEDNQSGETDSRITEWVSQIKSDLGI